MLSELLLSHFIISWIRVLIGWFCKCLNILFFFLKLNIPQKWETTKWVYVQTRTSASYHHAQTPFISHYSTLLVWLISQNFLGFLAIRNHWGTVSTNHRLHRHSNGGTTTVLHRHSMEAPQPFCTGTLMQGPAEIYTDSLMEIFLREACRNNYDVCL